MTIVNPTIPSPISKIVLLAKNALVKLQTKEKKVEQDEENIQKLADLIRTNQYTTAVHQAIKLGLVNSFFQDTPERPEGFHSKTEVSEILGFSEYVDPDTLVSTSENLPKGVKITRYIKGLNAYGIELPNEQKFVKKDAMGIDEVGIYSARVDLVIRKILQKYFLEFIVPDAMAYLGRDNHGNDQARIISRHLNGDTNETSFNNMDFNYRKKLSIALLIVGLRDQVNDNVIWHEEVPSLFDFGEVFFDRPSIISLSYARVQFGRNAFPFIDPQGNNKLEYYMEELDWWKRERFSNEIFRADIRAIIQEFGLSTEETDLYISVLDENIGLFEENVSTFIAISEEALPKHMLKKLGWRGSSEPRVLKTIPSAEILQKGSKDLKAEIVQIPYYGQVLIEIGNGFLLLMEPSANGFRLTSLDRKNCVKKQEIIKNKFVIGRRNCDVNIDDSSVGFDKNHAEVELVDSNFVKLKPLDIDFNTRIWV